MHKASQLADGESYILRKRSQFRPPQVWQERFHGNNIAKDCIFVSHSENLSEDVAYTSTSMLITTCVEYAGYSMVESENLCEDHAASTVLSSSSSFGRSGSR